MWTRRIDLTDSKADNRTRPRTWLLYSDCQRAAKVTVTTAACVEDLRDYGCPNLHACWVSCVDRERGVIDKVEACIDQNCDLSTFCG
jgi:hypothetical protein